MTLVSYLFVKAAGIDAPSSFNHITEACIVGGDAAAEAPFEIGVGWRSTGYMAS